MTTDAADTQWTVQGLLDLFDAQPTGPDTYTVETGLAGADERQVVDKHIADALPRWKGAAWEKEHVELQSPLA